MRDILFRGKRKDNGEWVKGYLFCDVDCGETEILFVDYEADDYGVESWRNSCEVDPETVGQYTGLTDKNGTKIFEGDIVKSQYGELLAEVKAEVFNCSCCHGVYGFSTETTYPDIGDTLVVVGNIHDNPELLEGEK